MKCSELLNDTPVVFKIYSSIFNKKICMDGSVIYVSAHTNEVCVGWMEGYKYRTDYIPYKDMIAAYDENGEMMSFENIKGKSVLLTAE